MFEEKAPWKDFEGNDIHEGDTIRHPDGKTGLIITASNTNIDADKWRVQYSPDDFPSRLCMQIGDKGQAVICTERSNRTPVNATQPVKGARIMSKSHRVLVKQLEVVKRMIKEESTELGRKVIDQAIGKIRELSRYSMSAGAADQYRAEAQACRIALGFEKDSESVSPVDLTEAISKIKEVQRSTVLSKIREDRSIEEILP